MHQKDAQAVVGFRTRDGMSFRGTRSEMENGMLYVDIYSAKGLFPKNIGKASISLMGILESGYRVAGVGPATVAVSCAAVTSAPIIWQITAIPHSCLFLFLSAERHMAGLVGRGQTRPIPIDRRCVWQRGYPVHIISHGLQLCAG